MYIFMKKYFDITNIEIDDEGFAVENSSSIYKITSINKDFNLLALNNAYFEYAIAVSCGENYIEQYNAF